MTLKFKLDTTYGRKISWPAKCVVCGGKDITNGQAECSMVTNASYRVIYWGWTRQKISIEYPICRKHKMLYLLPCLLSRRNLFNLGVGFLVVFVLIFGILIPLGSFFLKGTPIQNKHFMVWEIIFVITGMTAFLVGKMWAPVKLHGADERSITISINNDNYAREFEALNKENLIG